MIGTVINERNRIETAPLDLQANQIAGDRT